MLRSHRNHLVAAFVAASIPLTSLPDEPVPPLSRSLDAAPRATLKSKPTTGITMGSFRVRFEVTKLGDVRKAAGIGKIEHQGDASESIYWLCYTIPGTPVFERVWIIAHGEMGGPDHHVTGAHALRLASGIAAAEGCPLLPASLRPVAFDRGLWLDVSAQHLTAKLGAPSLKKDGWWSYYFAGKAPGLYQGEKVQYDVSCFFEAQIKEGGLVAIRASQVTSY